MENAPEVSVVIPLFFLFRHSGEILVEHRAGAPPLTQGFSYRKHGKAGKVGNNLLKPCKLQRFSHLFPPFPSFSLQKKTEKSEIILLNHVNYMVFRIYFRLFRLFRHSGKILVEHGAGAPPPTQGFSHRKHGKANINSLPFWVHCKELVFFCFMAMSNSPF